MKDEPEAGSIEEIWRLEREVADKAAAVSREDLVTMVQDRAKKTTAEMRQRLGREIGYYLMMLAFLLPCVELGFRPASLGIAAGMALVLAGVMATLHLGSRRLAILDLEGAAADSLRRTIGVVDATMRAYMVAYMLCIVLGVGLVGGLVLYKHPREIAWIVPALLGAALAVAWSYLGGRRYLDRRFGGYRAELARCLASLEQP